MPKKPRLPSQYKGLIDKINAMGKERYSMEQDPNFPERVTIVNDKTHKSLTVNLASHDSDVLGRVCGVASNAGRQETTISPELRVFRQGYVAPDSPIEKAKIRYDYLDSSNILGGMVQKAFRIAGKNGDVNSAFRRVLSEKNE